LQSNQLFKLAKRINITFSFMKLFYLVVLALCIQTSYGQQNYSNGIQAFQKNYVATHEVVKGKNKKYFRFFAIDSNYRVNGRFEKKIDTIGFTMKTSGNDLQHYFKYGTITFTIRDTMLKLFVYQSKDLMKTKEYDDYLFVPFADVTTGDESYGSGRYIDFTIPQMLQNTIIIDFNKAYNPYCAYSVGYHCPVPPKENFLPIAIRAGEMTFGKAH
jgi:uncharacterized protein (DUF1684 family)